MIDPNAINRRLRGRLPVEELNAPMSSPFISPGEFGFEQPVAMPGAGPFMDPSAGEFDPTTQAFMAETAGRQQGLEAVARRQAMLSGQGLGSFTNQAGGPAVFGTGQGNVNPFSFTADTGGIGETIRNISEAVRRRLEQLGGGIVGRGER